MNRITTNVDQKLLRTTKFPAEFSQKVDTSKIHIPVIKNWAAGEVSKILGYEDDVVIGLLFDLLEGSKHPDIKSLQIQLTGFLGKDASLFCKELWTLCLDAQKSDTGIPKQLVEAKKLELIQEKIESERAAEEVRRRRDEDRARERELEDLRYRERRDRGRGRGDGGGRGYDRRPPRGYSRSPPPRNDQARPFPSRDADTYVPRSNGRATDRRYRSRSRSSRPKSPNRSDQRSPKRRRVSSRSSSRSPDRRTSRRGDDRRRGYSPRSRRSPVRRYRDRSRSFSRPPHHDRRRRSRSRSRSRLRRNDAEGSDEFSRRRRRPSISSSEHVKDGRTNVRKDRSSPAYNDRSNPIESLPKSRSVSRDSGLRATNREPPQTVANTATSKKQTSSGSTDQSPSQAVNKQENHSNAGTSETSAASTTTQAQIRPRPLNANQLRERLLKQRLIAMRRATWHTADSSLSKVEMNMD